MTSDSSPSLLCGPYDQVLDLMQCPRCAGELRVEPPGVRCAGCVHLFPVREGIPLLAIPGTAETWSGESKPETSNDYQDAYQDLEEAKEYNEAYRDRPTKRWSTDKERRLLRQHLGSQPRSGVLLDLPSGGGRLSGILAEHTDLSIEADIGLGQLLYARQAHEGDQQRVWMTASAFHIPFRDDSVDGVVCCRLCHHLPTREERERLVRELLRVARGFVIMTFFDHHSLKNYNRRIRRPFNRLPPKMTMTVKRVAELALQNGAELITWPALSYLFSGHRYALMVKR